MRRFAKTHGRRSFLALVGGFGVTLLGGCAARQSVIWENPEIPRDDWPLDNSDCRRLARRKVEQEFGAAELDKAPDNIPGGTQGYQRNMTKYEAGRRQTQLFEDCMRQRGYRPMQRKDGKPAG